MTKAMEHWDDKCHGALCETGMEHYDDKGWEHCADRVHGAL